jgi:ribosomal protein S12 methylthiotransferase
MTFIKDIRFDHLGVFTYSDSDDLKSHLLKNHVPSKIAEKRHGMLMAAQAKISVSINEKHVDKTFEVLVEENPEKGVYIGRTKFQAPEVDGVTFIYANGLEIGTFVKVRITEAFEYDIAGEIL